MTTNPLHQSLTHMSVGYPAHAVWQTGLYFVEDLGTGYTHGFYDGPALGHQGYQSGDRVFPSSRNTATCRAYTLLAEHRVDQKDREKWLFHRRQIPLRGWAAINAIGINKLA